MKKFYRFVAAILIVMASISMLASCASETDNTAPNTDNQASVDTLVENDVQQPTDTSVLEAAYGNVLELNLLPAMIPLNDAYVDAYYGISAESVSDKVFFIAEDALLADTVIVVKPADGTSPDDLMSTFESFNNQKKLELESYNPDQYARVDNAEITAVGEYVFYIVSDNNNVIIDTFKNNLSL